MSKDVASNDDLSQFNPASSHSTSVDIVHRSPQETQELAITLQGSNPFNALGKKNYEDNLLMEDSSVQSQRCVGDIAYPVHNLKLEKLFNTLATEADSNKVLIRKTTKKCFKGKQICPRSSKYRGVSKNGSLWQVSNLNSC